MSIQTLMEESAKTIEAHLTRQTLATELTHLNGNINTLIFLFLECLPLCINDHKPEAVFNLDSFKRKMDPYTTFSQTKIGQWVLSLLETHNLENSCYREHNPWLEGKARLDTTDIATTFQGDITSQQHLILLFGHVLELKRIHQTMDIVIDVAGKFGDYSLAHNQTLSHSLNRLLISFRNILPKALDTLSAIIIKQRMALTHTPASQDNWVVNYRHCEAKKTNGRNQLQLSLRHCRNH